jgi:hypothetical protein
MPSLELRPVVGESRDEDAYWAPFDLQTGNSAKGWQTLELSSGAVVAAKVSPLQVRWGPAKSSVWPHKQLVEVVPPGKYELRAKIAIDKQNSITSNVEMIEVVAR